MSNRLVQPFLHSSWQKVQVVNNGRPFPQNCPFPQGDLEPHLKHDSLGPSEPTMQTASWSVQPFLHRWLPSVPILTMGRPFSPKIGPSHGGSGLPSNTGFPGPTWVLNPNGTSIGPLPSIRHHRSNGDCLQAKRENYQVCSVKYCVQQLCTVQCTHIRTHLTVLWTGSCLTGPISLCLDSFLWSPYVIGQTIIFSSCFFFFFSLS